MSDDLRARIAQAIVKFHNSKRPKVSEHIDSVGPDLFCNVALMLDVILPLVEQEIQQEREKLGVQLNDQMREVAVLQRRALAEKDAQIAALQQAERWDEVIEPEQEDLDNLRSTMRTIYNSCSLQVWPDGAFRNVLRRSALNLTESQIAGVGILTREAVENWRRETPAPPQEKH